MMKNLMSCAKVSIEELLNKILQRNVSLFSEDIQDHRTQIKDRVHGARVLVRKHPSRA